MPKTEPVTTIEVQESLTDVLYLTNQGQMPSEIKRLLKQKELSFSTLAIDEFAEIGHRLDLIGTVIIDAEGLDVLQQQKLARIIESLEMKNVSTILLSSRTELPVKSFSLAPVKSFSLVDKMESVRIDELWTKISTSLAFRKRGSGTAAEPVFPPTPVQSSNNNRVAEELSVIQAGLRSPVSSGWQIERSHDADKDLRYLQYRRFDCDVKHSCMIPTIRFTDLS